MKGLPEYQQSIYAFLESAKPFIDKYGAENSPLGPQDASLLAQEFQSAQKHCAETLKSDFPRIMLYGIYNSGKSTLLNALMGEEKAEVGDIPKTDKVTPYKWNGYELLDTPGIDAPIEHQLVSEDALTRCQIVLFVVSAARSFENRAIFEAMRDVKNRGKRLFIVMNDKEGLGIEHPRIQDAKKAVQRHLEEVGVASDHSTVSIRLVNAQLALEGRLENDDELIQESGIVELEQDMVREIRRVNGFAVVSDLCFYLIDRFDPFINKLTALGNADGGNHLQDFFAIREEYGNFCVSQENKVEEECSSMQREFLACFPSIENAACQVSQDEIKQGLEAVAQRYGESLNGIFQLEINQYKNRLSSQLQKLLELGDSDQQDISGDIGDTFAKRIAEHLAKQPQFGNPDSVSADRGNNICDKVESVSTVLAATPLASSILKLPIPWLPPISLPVQVILAVVPALVRAIFGKSKAQKEAERIEAEAAARRAAEEEHARNVAAWRHELQQQCQDMATSFMREAKKNVRQTLKNLFEPIINMAEEELRTKTIAGKDMIADVSRFSQLRSSLLVAKAELQQKQ